MPQESPPPRVFLSYSHDSPAHRDRVLALADRLRADGVDARLDRWVQAPPEGWPRWMVAEIDAARFVLVVCTETYERRFRAGERFGTGRGVTWEGGVITQELYDAQGRNEKFLPVVLTAAGADHVPAVLRATTRYRLDRADGYETLYRRLTDQPAVPMPPLGRRRPMPPRRPVDAEPEAAGSAASPAADRSPRPGRLQRPLGGRGGDLQWAVENHKGILALAAAVPLLLYGLGLFAHRSRESLLGLEQELRYSWDRLVVTGLDLLWTLASNAPAALVAPHPVVALGAWMSLAAILSLTVVRRRLPPRRRRAGTTAILLLVLLLLFFAAAFVTAALYPRHAPDARGPDFAATPGGSRFEAAAFEAASWLDDDTDRSSGRRRGLGGLVPWLLSAAAVAAWVAWRGALQISPPAPQGALSPWVRWGAGGLLALLCLHFASLLPRAHVFAGWGLAYPAVTVQAGEGCDPAVAAALAAGGCCAFDVAEGGEPRVLLLRGGGCPPDRGAFTAWAGEKSHCVEPLSVRRVVYHGCG